MATPRARGCCAALRVLPCFLLGCKRRILEGLGKMRARCYRSPHISLTHFW